MNQDNSTSSQSPRLMVVDRLEGQQAVLIDDEGATTQLKASELPQGCRSEGAVLLVPLDSGSKPVWNKATRDRAEERRRLSAMSARLSALRKKDPGGDVTL